MDTSEQYIKMCDCPEIQELWGVDDGDFLASHKIEGIGAKYKYITWCLCDYCNVADSYGTLEIDSENKKGYVWLPRQDQLQEMANSCDCTDPLCLMLDFHKWVVNLPNPSPPYTDSFEQLWLAFVMKEKFGKEWDGNEWTAAKVAVGCRYTHINA